MLWAIQMAASGLLPLYLSGYVEAKKSEYSAALQDAQKKLSCRRIIEFMCGAIVACSEEESETRQALQELPGIWQERGSYRRGSTAARALPLLVQMPVVSVKVLAAELKVSTQAANQALQRLEQTAVVRESSGRGRGRIFAAEEIISVLGRPFGADTDIALEAARNTLLVPSSGIRYALS